MKHHRILFLTPFILLMQPAMALADNLIPDALQNEIAYWLIVAMLLLFVVSMLVLLKAFKVLTRAILKSQGYTDEQVAAEIAPPKKVKKPKADVWNKLLSLRPLAEEKELLIAHDYDGIQELDNPIPAWFMYLFYATIIFSAGYLLNYHVFHIGQLQYEEYRTEMAQADLARKAYLSKAANRVDENTVKLDAGPAVIASGQAIFKQSCVPCHGNHAQGVVGPNLTDDYWLHGGKINEVFKTIKYGVQAKGMPTWEKQLSPKQISDVANYIKSLHGTNPAGAKEPQGEKESDDAAKAVKKA
jgi:cytochrome c oxidase cbb3-type subunit 3